MVVGSVVSALIFFVQRYHLSEEQELQYSATKYNPRLLQTPSTPINERLWISCIQPPSTPFKSRKQRLHDEMWSIHPSARGLSPSPSHPIPRPRISNVLR